MRKILFILTLSILVIFIPKFCSAAITAGTVYEVGKTYGEITTTAGNVNGGGFDSSFGGTDFSQQAVAELTRTDLASTQASGWLTLTSATGGFTNVMVGNIIHITAGTNFTAGWYQITAWTDTNTITVDRACGATANASAGTGYVGGAMSLGSTLDDDFFEIMVAGNKVWVKSGTFNLGEAVSLSVGTGSIQNPVVVEGYNATRGDTPTGTSRPTIAGGANTFTLTTGANNWKLLNLIFTGTASPVLSLGANNNMVINAKVTNSSTTAGRIAISLASTDAMAVNCEAVSYRGDAFSLTGENTSLYYSYAHDSDRGVRTSGTFRGIIGNIIESNVTVAIQFTSAAINRTPIINNTLYGSEARTGTGIIFITATTDIVFMNNIVYGFTTGISHADANQKASYDDYNAYYNNDTNATNWTLGANSQTLLNPSFVNVTQVTGTTGAFAAGGSKLIDTSKNFVTLGVTAGRDVVYIISGTGITAGQYLIDSISTTTNPNDTLNITIPQSPGTNTTADKTYQITTGDNFAIGTNLKAKGFPGLFQGGLTQGFMDIGAAQRQEEGGSGTGGIRGRIRIR